MIYRDRLAIWADKYLFLVFFLAGSIAIVALKLAHFTQLVVTAVPVIIMLVYGAYVLITPRYRIRSDRAGDSLYYLGFLYTMVSLAYSLYEFKQSDANTADIVTNFGIALATTILGLALRVMYHQMREDPFDTEQEARVDLSQAAKALHGVLLDVERDFESLRLTVSQIVTEAAHVAKTQINIVATEIQETTKLQTEFLTKFSEQAAQELRSHHSEMLAASKSMSAAVKRIAERLDKVEVPPEMIKDRLAKIEIPTDLIKERIENVQIPSDLIRSRLERVEIPEDLIRHRLDKVEIPSSLIREKLDQVEIPPDIFTARFDALMNQLQAIVTAVADRATRDTEAIKQVETLLKAAVDAAEKLKLAITTVQTDDERRREQLNAGVEAFTKAVTSLETTTNRLASLTGEYVDEQKTRLNELSASTALVLKTVEGHRQQLERELASSTAAVGQVHSSLVSLTRTVVEKVNGRA
jgi:hypothetical protein